jgi:hypothetical protein
LSLAKIGSADPESSVAHDFDREALSILEIRRKPQAFATDAVSYGFSIAAI